MWMIFCKGLGAALLLAAGGAAGWKKGEVLSMRVKLLEDMILFLRSIQNNLTFRCDRTENLMSSIAAECRFSVLRLPFQDLSQGDFPARRAQALADLEADLSRLFTKNEIALFCGVLSALGSKNGEEETRDIAYTATRLETLLETARREEPQKKLYRTLGFSAGAALALLLV